MPARGTYANLEAALADLIEGDPQCVGHHAHALAAGKHGAQ